MKTHFCASRSCNRGRFAEHRLDPVGDADRIQTAQTAPGPEADGTTWNGDTPVTSANIASWAPSYLL